jgi:hypothetical protein
LISFHDVSFPYHEDLRVDTYEDLFKNFLVSAERAHDKDPPQYRSMIDTIVEILSHHDPHEQSSLMLDYCLTYNFKSDWLKKGPKEKKRSVADELGVMQETPSTCYFTL